MRWLSRPPVAAAVLTGLVMAAGAVAFVGLDEDGGGSQRAVEYLPGNPRVGDGGKLDQVPEANCTQWRAGSRAQQMHVVKQLGDLFSRRTVGGKGSGHKLPDDLAYDALEGACSQDYARAFKLWKVYERALAFQYRR